MIKTEKVTFGKVNPEGNNILITTGLHGNEIAPIIFGTHLIKELEAIFKKPERFFGFDSVTIINGINIPGIMKNERDVVDVSGSDPNRGWGAENLDVQRILNELTKYKDTHFLIDIHSSVNCSDMFLYNVRQEMPYHFWGCVSSDIPYAIWESESYSLKSFFRNNGVTYEIAGMEKLIDFRITSIILKDFLKMLAEKKEITTRELTGLDTLKYMKAPYTGILSFSRKDILGLRVRKGEHIGEIVDFKGNIIHYIRSDYSGRVVQIHDRSFVNAGDDYIGIQPTIK